MMPTFRNFTQTDIKQATDEMKNYIKQHIYILEDTASGKCFIAKRTK